MNTYYVSLVQCLIGYCIKVIAPSEAAVKAWAAMYLGRMWCSVYSEPGEMVTIGHKVFLDEENATPEYVEAI